jgi:choline dehydrogenase-like flavoprotein
MFVDARGIPHGSVIEADLCIVGAGPAGITLARQFIGTGINVCLIESGGFAVDRRVQSLSRGDSIGLGYADLESCQIRCFGGNSNAWGGWCRPLDPLDFRQRPWIKDSGWPIPHADLATYYRAAHELCEMASTEYELEDAIRQLADRRAQVFPFDGSRLETTLYRFSPPTRFGTLYRDAIRNAANVRCLLHANGLGIATSDDARVATRLSVGCLSGTRFVVTARLFVLAAGGIENPRLLLLSNDVMTKGLGNHHDLVGRYFMDHPHSQRVLIVERRAALGLYGLCFKDRGISARISLPAAVQEREQLLNYSANIYPVYVTHGSRGWRSFRNLVFTVDPRRRTDPYLRFSLPFESKRISLRQIGDILRELHKVAFGSVLQLVAPDRFVSFFILESKPEQAPNPLSRITLASERDALGLNRIQAEWRLLPIDRRTVERAEGIIDLELRRLGIGNLRGPALDRGLASPPPVAGGWHQMGTTRAHVDPRRGVVDADGRVHGMANLYVAGASVFPTGGTATPTLTIVALALRLADHLKLVLQSPARAAARPLAREKKRASG